MLMKCRIVGVRCGCWVGRGGWHLGRRQAGTSREPEYAQWDDPLWVLRYCSPRIQGSRWRFSPLDISYRLRWYGAAVDMSCLSCLMPHSRITNHLHLGEHRERLRQLLSLLLLCMHHATTHTRSAGIAHGTKLALFKGENADTFLLK